MGRMVGVNFDSFQEQGSGSLCWAGAGPLLASLMFDR